MLMLIGYAVVLAAQILMLNNMDYNMQYIFISVLFLIGYALVFYKVKGGE